MAAFGYIRAEDRRCKGKEMLHALGFLQVKPLRSVAAEHVVYFM